MNYKDTLFLPETEFSMKANLPVNEPKILEKWKKEKLYEKLNQSTKCYLYIIGCDDIDFSNPDSSIWIFEMNQWSNNIIPKNTTDAYGKNTNKQNKFIVYREYMEEISVEELRLLIDSHWKEFEKL